MAETYIQMFQEKIYPEVFLKIAEETIERFVEREEQILEEWKKGIKQYMEQLVSIQKMTQDTSVSEINISFLYTSLYDEKPVFRIDSYCEGGRVIQESMLTAYLPADWLVAGMDKLEQMLTERAARESMRRYVRAAEIETLKLRAVRSLVYYFALRFKYLIQDMIDFKCLAQIQKSDSFVIQIGEYMDWQKTIYAIFPEVDIFNCDKKTDLRFRNFPAIYYKDKRFEGLNLTQARFQDCTFMESTIENCVMNDCLFENCIFEHVKLTNTKLSGCLFQSCTFRQVDFENDSFYQGMEQSTEPEYFEPAEFFRCSFTDSNFRECSLSQCIITDCEGLTSEEEV